jgi:replication initiation protein RepC
VEAGLIIRKDSANGKRYARKDEAGKIESAFGFDISPLLARSEELAAMAQQVMADRAAFKRAKENLTICRRDVRKLIAAAIEERAEGDWKSFEDSYAALAKAIPRTPSTSDILTVLTQMNQLRQQVLNQLETKRNSAEVSSNAAHHEQHIQNSDSESIHESEQCVETVQEEKTSKADDRSKRRLKAFPLDLVLKACPTIGDYNPAGNIVNWRDLMSASVAARSALGVSPSAYQSACEAMGQENAAVAIACVLERASFITSPGGYLRDLTRRASRGEFSLGPMLMALLRVNMSACGKTG